jgi:hypothetical protein
MNNLKTVSAPKSATNKNGNLSSAKKVDAKIIAKANRKMLKAGKKEVHELWLTETRSMSALRKWAENEHKSGSIKISPFLEPLNAVYGTNYKVTSINSNLLAFAYEHEKNKVNDEYVFIEKKRLFTINFFMGLLERKARIKGCKETFAKMQSEAKTRFIVRKAEAKASQELQAEFDSYAVEVVESFNA